MKINNIKINGFGKLENKEINFKNNINLIYGENEAGKTTLLKFISGIFYGISRNKNKKEISDFERYKTWGEKDFSGKIEYSLDNKETYEVFRDFTKKNPKIYKDSEDVSNNFNIDKTKGNEFFYEQTGIDEGMFYSTTLIEQKGVVLDSSEQSVLTQKIANLLSTGEENISYKKTIDKLNKKLVEEVGNERTVGRPINIICDRLNRIKEEQENIQKNDEIKSDLEKKKNNIKNKIQEKELKLGLIKEIKKINENTNIENEKIIINKNLKEEEIIKINNIENKIRENKNKKEEKNLVNIIIFSLLFILNIILFVFKINKIINITFISVTIIFTAFTIFKIIKNNKKIKQKENIEKNYLEQIELIENNVKKIQKNIDEININKQKNDKINKEKIKEKYLNKIDVEELEYLFRIKYNEISNIQEELEKEISGLKLQLYTTEIDFNNAIRREEEKAKLQEQEDTILEEKDELLKLEKSINIAKEAIQNAYNKMKNEITPKFTKNLSNIVSKISKGKYNKIKFIEGEGLIVELENGEYINANRLSIGTIDQLYLSLRLSAMQEITEEKMPIILDETFAYYDNRRLENILKYINEELKENQVIIFTCSDREQEILEKNNIEYNYINLHKTGNNY